VSSGFPTYRGDKGIYPEDVEKILTTDNFNRNPMQNIYRNVPKKVEVSDTYKYIAQVY